MIATPTSAHHPIPTHSWQEQLPALRSDLSPSPVVGVVKSLLVLRACVEPKGPHLSSRPVIGRCDLIDPTSTSERDRQRGVLMGVARCSQSN